MLPVFRKVAIRLAALSLVAGSVTAGTAATASAAPCSPWPTCSGGAGYFQAIPFDNALWEANGNPANGNWIRTIPSGYTLYVFCQANNGPSEDGEPGTTWDFAWDAGLQRYVYVYDWWMNTPPEMYNGYSWPNSAWHCNF
ncbi:MAG TPA: hypothetical protein VKV38_11045 [Trebonia sp.]|jgi:hypothetical protein|nr:hypothetical protein [Trebonia sp.]